MQNKLMKFIPYPVVLLIFAAVTLFYFSPQMEGKVLQMHDIVQYEGMRQDIAEHREAYNNEDPQWAGNMFGGMPTYLIDIRYDSVLVKYISKAVEVVWRPASLIFLAMAAFWIMLLLWGVNPWIGLVPSLAYGLSTYLLLIIGAGHITKMVAMAYAPLLLGSVFFAYRKNMWIGAGLTALFAALEIYANHPQITYYFIFVLLAFWINEGIVSFKEKVLPRFVKVTGLLALAGILAVGANFAPLWYVQQHAKYTMRGGTELTQTDGDSQSAESGGGLSLDYATMWSYGKAESFNMFIPNFYGGSSSTGFDSDGEVAQSLIKYNAKGMAKQLPAYWGDQPGTGGPTYLGAVALFLAVLGLFLLKGRVKYWIISVSVLALMLAWGRNFMWLTELFFNYFPLYDKFRTVAMILVILQWSVPFVAALVLGKLWKGELTKEEILKALKKSVIIVGGVALLFIVFAGMLFSFSSQYDSQLPADVVEAAKADRLSMLRADALRSLIFVLISAGVIWLSVAQKIKKSVFVLLLAVLVCADLVPVDMRFLSKKSFVEPKTLEVRPTQADLEIMKDTTLGYRVINFAGDPFSDAMTSYFHRSVGGYHGAKLQRYQDIISRHLMQMNWRVYSMLNTKYMIIPDKESGTLQVQLNPDAYGGAWFVDSVVYVDTPDQEIAILDTLDTRHVAVVDRRFEALLQGVVPAKDSTAKIELTDYRVNHLTYKYSAQSSGVAVFSEIYYDQGWTAWIDGVEQPYFRADYILRAMVVPAGEHTVEFKFRAPNFDTISAVTLISSILVILCALGAVAGLVFRCKKCKDKDERQ